MIGINAYSYLTERNKIKAEVLKYAIIAKVLGITVPDSLELKTVSPETLKKMFKEAHSDAADRVICLFGAGVIDENTALEIIKSNSNDFADDIIAAENRVISDNSKDKAERLPYSVIQNILICAINSKRYEPMQPLDYTEAEKIAGLINIRIVDGMVKVTDLDYYKTLVEIGEPFGEINKEGQVVSEDSKDNLLNNEAVNKGELDSNYYPFCLDPKKLIYYSEVWNKLYGKEFIIYAKENSITADEKFSEKYDEYITATKLHFLVKCYRRKRRICGNKPNWFDYAAVTDGAVDDKLNADKEKEINLEESENLSDNELIIKALEKFKKTVPLNENTVIELFHEKNKYLFVRRGNDFIPIEDKDFHKQLFDFNKLWSIIQKCSREHQIKAAHDRIVIPEEMYNEIPVEQREYADNLIREQYIESIPNSV